MSVSSNNMPDRGDNNTDGADKSASGNVLPSAARYPQPKAPGTVGSGNASIKPESQQQLDAVGNASGCVPPNKRPKGL